MGMDDRSALIEALRFSYESEYCRSGAPDWAFQGVAPAIPYIGERFLESPIKALIYASAENLASDTGHLEGLRTQDVRQQMVRSYGLKPRANQDQNVHIEPINNGALLKVARHILSYHPNDEALLKHSSKFFLEQVAVANPGKFSIDPAKHKQKVNLDYARDWKKFKDQIVYVQADLEHLTPHWLILPATIHRSLVRAGLKSALERIPTIVSIQQVQQRAIVRKHGNRVPKDDTIELPGGYGDWKAPHYSNTYIRWMIENAGRFAMQEKGRITL